MIIGYLMIVFVVLLALNIPVSFVLLVISTIYLIVQDIPLTAISQVLTQTVDSFILTAIPLFILAANFMDRGEITHRIVDFAKDLVGHLRGGLAHVNVVASMIFGGMSGSALADAGGLGMVEVKMMRQGGYDDEFTAAITAASSTIGPIIPPSIPFVLYGSIARESVGKLFLGGAIPGVLMGFALMIQAYFLSRKRDMPLQPRATFRDIVLHFQRVLLPLLTPAIILGGIVMGWFTPTEAGAVAAAYALILGKFVYRIMKWKDIYEAILSTAILTGVVLYIMAMAGLWSWMITNEGIADKAVELVSSISKSPAVLLLLLNITILLLGMFIEPLAIMIMILPVVLPMIHAYGIDTVHYGVVMTLGLMIGLITPPFGECLFLMSAIMKIPVATVARAVAPYVFGLICVLFLITYVPWLVMWLPNALF